jgi:hypothetical protein
VQAVGGALLLACAGTVWADGTDGGVSFHNVSADAGIHYERQPTPARRAKWEALIAMAPFPNSQQAAKQTESPQKQNGAPGVALFDYDNDGDIDIYVPNGPGAANSLFQNQLAQTGHMSFTDVAAAAGVTADNQDSSGVCVGDTDNDGDQDLFVVAEGFRNLFFRNNGNGTFSNVTQLSGLQGYGRNASGCSMGDVNGDGLLDIVVANTYDDWTNRKPVFVGIGAGANELQPNELYLNKGGNVFQDVSLSSGILNIVSGPPSIYFGGSYTWAISMVDYDQDGDVDIIWADTQGAPPADKSQERSAIRLFDNDGTGHFTDRTHQAGLAIWGSWMGLSFGDFNRDGSIDIFSTNFGVYMGGVVQNSRWLLGSPSGTFTDPQVGALKGTPFGWGTTVLDYDNDGDQDIAYFGDDDVFFFWASDNPGTLLRNDGSAHFIWDKAAMTTDHRLRQVQGVAGGDLNGDGFEDIVTVATYRYQPKNQRPMTVVSGGPTGSPFDEIATFENVLTGRVMPGFTTYLNPILLKGDLAIDLNSGGNGNKSVQFDLVGSKGLVANKNAVGKVNRDGIGAVVTFTPAGDEPSIVPITGGSSYGSTDSMVAHFGIGTAPSGVVEVLWPGGARNRLYDVKAGERLTLPEIPCSITGNSSRSGFRRCVKDSLKDLVKKGVISQSYSNRLEAAALRGYDAEH